MANWLGSNYEGDIIEGLFHGIGKYTYPNGVIYEGEFSLGNFHGSGVLTYPNEMKFIGKWENGREISGEIYFGDGLKYEKDNWNYCSGNNRLFFEEISKGIKASGSTQLTRFEDGPKAIPEGTYDTGNGYYHPADAVIYTYEGKLLRIPTKEEVEEISTQCRYNPLSTNSYSDGVTILHNLRKRMKLSKR